ncbi:MFS transporter [Paraburkholderia sp. SIMBA_055]|jgi:MFS family permease|uniref:Major facilitator superfamily MFS_1 n=2 Tax=Paraburkholderia TaxID=1822464 RepID=B1G4Y5_PARG4|nr:MFS transporter [Paraburkholderia graminis]ALE54934.1 membrane protein [Burkholderia sp. HB1]EDT08754.1 major facilitator superfamily MFS_1 [Paraburkholderia graminis C4D1M]CAB3643305.1 Putative tartrate transporter [Paraburkholderia graminis C4D1M]
MTSASHAQAVPFASTSDEELERQAVSKTAWRLLPLLTLAFIFNYIDRTSVGFAALSMNADLGLSATQFGWGAGILFAGYCLLEVPSNLMLYRYGARRWLARIMITWGIAAAATSLAIGPKSFYFARFVLGVAEAGFFPGVTFYLASWFPARYRTRMLAWFMVGVPVSSILSGPLSGLLLSMHGLLGLAGWKWMFILQGLPASIIGIIVLVMLRDTPSQASWLSDAERQALIRALASEHREKEKKDLRGALKDKRVLILTGIQFGFVLGSYGIGIWLPTILKAHGLSISAISLVSTVPYIFATVAMLTWARAVDRSGKKILNLLLTCLFGAGGMIVAAVFSGFWPAMIGITLAVIGVTTARAVFWSIPTRFLSGAAAAGGFAFINSVGTFGGFAGPFLVGWLKDITGSFAMGMLGMAAMLLVSTLLTASLRFFIKDER